jgi:hypothetical protein
LYIRLFLKPFLYFNIFSIIWHLLLSVKWRHLFSCEVITRPLKCACFLYNIHVTLQCIVVSALKKTSKVNTILKVVIFKHSVILFRCSMIAGVWEADDIVKFYIALLDFFPAIYFINEVNFLHYKKYGSVGRFTVFGTYVFKSRL